MQYIALILELAQLFQQLESDGTLAKLQEAGAALEGEFKSPVVQAILGKLGVKL